MVLPVHLEGTILEGGGQLIRVSVALAAISKIPIIITDIRGNRPPNGGLKLQHLTALNWLALMSHANVSGAQNKSRSLEFHSMPGSRTAQPTTLDYQIDVGSPGSVGLVFQAIFPFVAFSGVFSLPTPGNAVHHESLREEGCLRTVKPLFDHIVRPANLATEIVRLTIRGGTNVPFSPSYDYVSQVLLPTLSLVGLPPMSVQLESRGWSTGRAEIGSMTFSIAPLLQGSCLPAFSLTNRGEITSITATLLAPRSRIPISSDELKSVVAAKFPGIPLMVEAEDSKHPKRFYLLLVATSTNGYKLGRDWLLDSKISSSQQAATILVSRVVRELADELAHGGCMDVYMRDQLVIFQALARGRSKVDVGQAPGEGKPCEPSLHTKTAQWVVQTLLGVEFDAEGACEGVGFVAGEDFAARNSEGDSGDVVAREMEELHL